ncbi:MAG TPA: GNAT family N-acetyltransferase [Microlunatus sp.]
MSAARTRGLDSVAPVSLITDAVVRTDRLELSPPTPDDLAQLHRIQTDPRVWTHFPSIRPTEIEQTRALIERWTGNWQRDGLATWIVRLRGTTAIIGSGGCSVRSNAFWNLGYRFDADLHGQGYATEVSSTAIRRAREVRPELPIIAYLLEHNVASARVAEKVGLELVHRAPDAGNPDPQAIRLIYADRPLDPEVLDVALG